MNVARRRFVHIADCTTTSGGTCVKHSPLDQKELESFKERVAPKVSTTKVNGHLDGWRGDDRSQWVERLNRSISMTHKSLYTNDNLKPQNLARVRWRKSYNQQGGS